MATSKQLQNEIRRAKAKIKKANLEIRKLAVHLEKSKQTQKRLEFDIKNVEKVLRSRFRPPNR